MPVRVFLCFLYICIMCAYVVSCVATIVRLRGGRCKTFLATSAQVCTMYVLEHEVH